MATLVGTETDLEQLLDNLLQLDLDAVEGYDLAIGRAEKPEIRERLEEFKGDHIRHADEPAALLSEMGRKPTTGPGTRQMAADPFVSASIVGDKSILERLRSSEEDTNRAYERAVDFVSGKERAEDLVRRNLEDERRHRAWVEETLAKL